MERLPNLRKLSFILDTNGTAELVHQTKLYEGSFGFILLQVYAPITQNRSGKTTPLCTTHRITTDGGGNRVPFNYAKYNLPFVEMVKHNGKEYLLFERPMPKDYTDTVGLLEIVINYCEANESNQIVSRLTTNSITVAVHEGGANEGQSVVGLKTQELLQLNANTIATEKIVNDVENLIKTPDSTDANNVGIPEVTITELGNLKFTNLKGANGIQGVQGIKGDQGIQGGQGIQGMQGIKGVQGEKGDRGIQGIKGDRGLQGAKGDKGDQGLRGIQGIQGVQGIQGSKGEKGDALAIKKTYISVSEMQINFNTHIKNGEFALIESGNMDDPDNSKLFIRSNNTMIFVTDLSGARGFKGDRGEKGDRGAQGFQGETGKAGSLGNQGFKGDRGEKGERGEKGDPGTCQAVVYGVKIDELNPNPNTSVEYTDDAVGFTPSRGNDGNFISGSWDDKFPFNAIKPCMLKDGKVIGYLNPNNYAEWADGHAPAPDITYGNDGDVMVEFPKVYYKIENDGRYVRVRISENMINKFNGFSDYAHSYMGEVKDRFYVGAYAGYVDTGRGVRSLSGKIATSSQVISGFRREAQFNGSGNRKVGYEQMSYNKLLLLQILYLIRYKSLNSQEALGADYLNDSYAVLTGATNAKGMNYGKISNKIFAKCNGIENFWGNLRVFVDGYYPTSNSIKISDGNFNNTGEGYDKEIPFATATAGSGGYIKSVIGSTDLGFIPHEFEGSSTTFYSDSGSHSLNGVPIFGGHFGQGQGSDTAGVFSFSASTSTAANIYIGVRLIYSGN